VRRCAVEPDFFVRDMLTWALTRLPADETVPRLVAALDSSVPQELAQALHTLSKIGDRRGWQAQDPSRIGDRLIAHPDTEVARSAWRCAVALVPGDDRDDLADVLVTQLGRGDVETQKSLSRAIVALGEDLVSVLDEKLHVRGRHSAGARDGDPGDVRRSRRRLRPRLGRSQTGGRTGVRNQGIDRLREGTIVRVPVGWGKLDGARPWSRTPSSDEGAEAMRREARQRCSSARWLGAPV
jgi:hypothetical protein